MINAISKKTLSFRNPDNKSETITVKPSEYLSLPEWVKGDPMYKWAIKDGTLTIAGEKTTSKDGKAK